MKDSRRDFLKKVSMLAGGAAASAVPASQAAAAPKPDPTECVICQYEYTGCKVREVQTADGRRRVTYDFAPGLGLQQDPLTGKMRHVASSEAQQRRARGEMTRGELLDGRNW